MSKALISILVIFINSKPTFSQTKEYKLIDKTVSADINYHAIDAIDTFTHGIKMLNQVFKPAKGKYIVFRFIATYTGLSYTDKTKEFHDIIIVKTNQSNRIIDAYQYTLEWAELPSDTDLYKSTCKSAYLKDMMAIEEFKFTRPWYYDIQDRALKDTGNIKMR